MTGTQRPRRPALLGCLGVLAVFLATLLGGCVRPPAVPQTTIKPQTPVDLEKYLLSQPPDVEIFRSSGPYAVDVQENREIRVSPNERIIADLYAAKHTAKAPLVIFMHGYDSSKEAHANQAMLVASWGMLCLAVQLPKTGQWPNNGRALARLVSLAQRSPEAIDSRVNPARIVLVGHSFGATSVAIALAEGAPAAGAILLDPAAIGKGLPGVLQRIKTPVLVLGADYEVSPTRNRDFFYRYIRNGIAEISIKGAAHEDAQYPSEFSLQHLGFDPYSTEELQITFVSAIAAAAFSVSATGTFDYAWASFARALENGKFFNAKKK